MQGTLVKHNFEFKKTIWCFLLLYSWPSIAARSISVDSKNHTQKIICARWCKYYAIKYQEIAHLWILVSLKPGVCPRTKSPWILKNDYIPDYEHSSPTFQLQTLHHPQKKCHKEVGEWRDVKISSAIYPKYKFLFYNLIYMQNQTIKDLWHCGKSLGNNSIQVLQLSAITQNRV